MRTGFMTRYATRDAASRAFLRAARKASAVQVLGGGWWEFDDKRIGRLQGHTALGARLVALHTISANEDGGVTVHWPRFPVKIDAGICRWFARCGRPATGTTPHPVLGDVPTCDRCHKLATDEDREAAR